MSRNSPRQFTAAELIGDPIIGAIERLTAGTPDGTWCGSMTEALNELNARTTESVRGNPMFWPQNNRGLSLRLGRMGEGLRAAGIVVNIRARTGRTAGICFVRVAAKAA